MGGVKTGSSSASETGAPAESKKETEASASAAQVETTPAEGNPPEESGKSETEASGQTLKAQETESVPFAASQVTENGIQVNVTADAGVFPDNTQMKVTPVSSSDVQPLIENKIEQASVTDMFAVDISFYCDGQKTEPDGNVNVSMSFPRSVSGDAAIWHVTDGQAEPVDASVSADTAKFSADSFSIYAIVGTEQKADLYTVNFYDGENLLRTQTIKNGDVLLAPSTPFHDGKTFLGWSSDDGKTFVTVGDDNVVTDLPENTGNTINLYAIYESTYKVTFYDVQGNIMDQMILPAGSTVDTSQYRCEIAEDEYIHTWTRNKDMSVNADGDTAGAGTVTVQDSDLAFYPLVKGVTWVFFNANSGDEDATYLEPEAVKNGSTLNAPENPARQGYTFDRWTRDPEGSQNYDFAGDVPSKLAAGGVLTLYAQWKEASTKYEVEIWRQVCKDGVYVEDNYEVADRFYVDGETGA